MCGIAGILGPPSERSGAALAPTLAPMLAELCHRGPDGAGMAGRGGCQIGISRLAIVGLADAARPFTSEDGTVFCVCNGEIYNSPKLRRELTAAGHRFRTEVDTEVVLHLWQTLGEELVHRLDGMFAFAIWDSAREVLVLGRDRAGEKPLFYWGEGGTLVFASEIRALLAHPDVRARVDPRAFTEYLTQGFMPAPLSPIAGIHKLPAGHLLIAHRERIEIRRYWDLADHFPAPGAIDRRSVRAIAAELDQKISLAVERRSRSDVPFGVFLSGGIDSSTILAHLTELHGRGIPAFTLGHTDRAFDEAVVAAETARHFGAELHSLVLNRDDLEEGLRVVGRSMDEPLGDASTIPTYLLARLASEQVKVVLSGEGADELFGGYPTYLGHRFADRLQAVPAWLCHALVGGARRLMPPSMGNVGFDYLVQQFAAGIDLPRLERHKVWFGSLDRRRLGEVLSPGALAAVAASAETPSPFGSAPVAPPGPPRRFPDPLAELLYTDFTQYLQDDLLTKVDRATMLVSLEARAAFLDHELAEFVAGIPSRHKICGLETKAILRRAVRDRLPPAVLARRKRGFNIPFSRWLLEGLGDELRERFSPERAAARGLFSAAGVGRLLDEHMERRADHRKPLFALLAFDLWCDRTFGDGAHVPLAEAAATAPDLPPLAIAQ